MIEHENLSKDALPEKESHSKQDVHKEHWTNKWTPIVY